MTTIQVCVRDGLDLLRGLADGAAAAVVTDPPWNRRQDYGSVGDDRPVDAHSRWLGQVVDEALRVATDAVVLLPGEEHTAALVGRLAERHAWWWELRWRPPEATVRPPATIDLRDAPVLWIRHHAPHRADTSVVRTPLTADPHLAVHPCPKPSALFRDLIDRCVAAPGPVVDPFVGTGSVLAAARDLGRGSIGSDLNPAYCHVARQRVERGTQPGSGTA